MSPKELGMQLIRLHLLRRRYTHRAAGPDVPVPGQFPLLKRLIANPGTTQQELSAALLVSPAAVALSTKRMEKAGLLEKRADPDNRRRNLLFATQAGRDALEAASRVFGVVDELTFAGFDEAERAQLGLMLGRMIHNLSDGEETPLPCFEEVKDKA